MGSGRKFQPPSARLQRNPKTQIPNPNKIPSSKFQKPRPTQLSFRSTKFARIEPPARSIARPSEFGFLSAFALRLSDLINTSHAASCCAQYPPVSYFFHQCPAPGQGPPCEKDIA